MKQFNKIILSFLFVLASFYSTFAQKRYFSDINEKSISLAGTNRVILPTKYRTVSANTEQLRSFLWSLPSEKSIINNRNAAPIMELPMPDGRTATFRVWESSIQEPGLEAKFPEIRTFTGQGISDPYATIRFDFTPRGFHAQILTINGTYYMDPFALGNTENYISYFRSDVPSKFRFECGVQDQPTSLNRVANPTAACRGTEMRTYRIAVACTGEYAQAPGVAAGTNAAILHAAIVTSINRVVGVYEKEVSLRMVLVANNNIIEYLNAGTDPFNGNNNANTLINESQTVITANIGAANYDIGHTFSTGGGGLAGLGVVCNTTQKARGITGSPQPTGDAYDIDYVAHEIGHQWGGNHSMAGCGNSPAATKYEVGSGTSIQAYAGICGAQDIQPNSDPIFHPISFDEISNYIAGNGGSCGVPTPTGNNLPVIDALPSNVTIPISTPFTLTGTATDADGDALSYSWDQWDFSGTRNWNSGATAAANNTDPLFKSRIPKVTGSRTFPDPAVILAGFPANPAATLGGLKGETLSPVARPMKFRFTVRDNRAGGGGVVSAGAGGCLSNTPFTVTVGGTAPFIVTVPNGGESYAGGSTQTITWNVSGTSASPFDVANVRISLSTDGGQTYPTIISTSTPNDGTEDLSIPSIATTTARVRVEAIGNIFFDISNANFTITAPATGFTFNSAAPALIACGSAASGSVTLATAAQGGFNTPITLTASGNPAGTTVSFSVNPLTPGSSSTVTLNNTNTLVPGTYNVTVTGTAGTLVQNSIVSFTVQPGTPPAITTQPTGSTVCAGSDAVFTAASSAAGASYQWQVSSAGGPFTNITGATSATYTATGVAASQNNNQYQVVVSTLCGTSTSSAATLVVNTAPAISTQPADAVICAGNDITFSVGATGANLSYQWQVSTTGCAGPFNNISGATSSSLSLTGVTIAQNNYAYQAVITGTCAPTSVTSSCALLSVSSSVGIVSQPSNIAACAGSDALFTVTASGSGVNYQWQVSTAGGPFTNISGATGATLTVPAVTAAANGNQYQAVLTNATCTTPSFTSAATLTVNDLPVVSAQPVNATICAGGDNTFTATAGGTNITYQWQVSTNGGANFTDIAGATSASYTVSAATAAMNNNQYHVVVSGTCTPAAISSDAVLTVISPVSVTSQPTATPTCAGSDATFTVVGNSGGAPSIGYQWQVSTGGGPFTNITGATNASLTLAAVTSALNGNQYQVVLSNATCAATATSTPVSLVVNALPNVTATASAASVCTGTNVQLTGSGASTYTWTGTTAVGSTVTVNPTVNPTAPGVPNPINYTVTGTDLNGCVNTSVVTVTANPLPSVTLSANPSNTNLVPGQSVVLTASVTPAGPFTFTWFKNGIAIPNFSGTSITATVNDLGSYSVTAADPTGLCANTSSTINVTDSATTRFYIYPNPNDGQFTIAYHNPGGVSVRRNVVVFDARGSRVYNKALAITLPYQLIKVDLRPAPAGVYIVVLYDGAGNRIASEKVVVQL